MMNCHSKIHHSKVEYAVYDMSSNETLVMIGSIDKVSNYLNVTDSCIYKAMRNKRNVIKRYKVEPTSKFKFQRELVDYMSGKYFISKDSVIEIMRRGKLRVKQSHVVEKHIKKILAEYGKCTTATIDQHFSKRGKRK